MKRFLVLAVVFIVAASAWLILDADPDGRQELVDRITNAFGGEEEAEPVAPNWGDVATKVGEFAEEERALREVLNPAFGGETPEGDVPPAEDADNAAADGADAEAVDTPDGP